MLSNRNINNGFLCATGGDDRRVLLWNVEKALSDIGEPVSMKGEHNSNIFCLAINKSNTKIYSGGGLMEFGFLCCLLLICWVKTQW